MTDDELERAAYARGDVTIAGLLARIADLQAALGRATAQIESLEEDLRAARYVERYERAYPGDPD
jgi:multidrug resistance efflux pump